MILSIIFTDTLDDLQQETFEQFPIIKYEQGNGNDGSETFELGECSQQEVDYSYQENFEVDQIFEGVTVEDVTDGLDGGSAFNERVNILQAERKAIAAEKADIERVWKTHNESVHTLREQQDNLTISLEELKKDQNQLFLKTTEINLKESILKEKEVRLNKLFLSNVL